MKNMHHNINEEIEKAYKSKDLSAIQRLTGLSIDVITGQRIMSRKERRKWYHDNKKRLSLPKWGELDTLNKK